MVKTGIEILANFIAPFAIYVTLKSEVGDLGALIVLAAILLSVLAFFGGGGVQMLQLRDNLVGGLIGLVFFGSVAIGRPLIYFLARASIQRTSPEIADCFNAVRDDPAVRQATLIMTLAWGTALVGECALASVLVFTMPIESYLIVGPIVSYTMLGAMTVWSFWFGRRRLGPVLGGQ